MLTKAESSLAEAKRLGDWYNEGIVVTEDHKMAARLYKKASDDGSVEATFMLGVCYSDELSEAKLSKAFKLMRSAAEGGSTTAKRLLGVYYSESIGTKKDMDKALDVGTKQRRKMTHFLFTLLESATEG